MKRVLAKCYGGDWLTTYGLDEVGAAARLASHGVDSAIIENRVLRTAHTAITQHGFPDAYDDDRFRDALRERGIGHYEKMSMFFRPEMLDEMPDLRPIDRFGRPMQQDGWYVGLCPTSSEYLALAEERAEQITTRFRPDGFFVSFIRFPGFWATWGLDTRREDILEYCFCERCLATFTEATGIETPGSSILERSTDILLTKRAEWTEWKQNHIAACLQRVASAIRRANPTTRILVNGLALLRSDFDDVVGEVLAQDLHKLANIADEIELMAYHQVMQRPLDGWVQPLVAEVSESCDVDLFVTLQLRASYLEDRYLAAGRAREVTTAEILDGLRVVAETTACGVALYRWEDLLEMSPDDEARVVRGLERFRAE